MARKRKLEWWESSSIYDFTDKEKCTDAYIMQMITRTQSMFKYEGLPASIPCKYLELYLQMCGHCAIVQVNGKLYALQGCWGGEPDPYYKPTKYVVSNPYLKLSKTFTDGDECIVIGNDSFYQSLYPILSRYATQLMENDISMHMVDINTRIQALIAAGDDRTKAAADDFLKGIYDGKLGAIYENSFLDGIKTQPYGATGSQNVITNLIEYHQYIKASFYNELGLQSNYNMKRESINSNESQLNEDMLQPLIDNMLKSRRQALEKINNLFGTDISVDLDSSWKDNKEEIKLELKALDEDSPAENESEEMEDEENETE